MMEIFKSMFLFNGVSEEDIIALVESVTKNIKSYTKGESIKLRGDEIKELSIVIEGEIQTEMVKINGAILKIDELKTGEIIAPAFLFGSNPKYPVDITAMSKTKILNISKSDFLEKFLSNKQILENFIGAISNKTKYLSRKIWYNVKYRTIKEKVIAYILENELDEIIKIPSIENLANEFGVERPSLSRVLTELVREGKLERQSRNQYIILNIDSLYNALE